MAAFSEVLTRFGLEFDEGKLQAFEKGTKRAERNMQRVAKSVDRFGRGVKRAIRFAASMVAAYAGLRTVRLFTTDVANQVKVLDDWAARLNLTTLQVEELAAVAKQKGVEIEDLGDIMKEVGVRVGEAFLEGSKDQKQFFDELGISKKQLFDGTMQKNSREQFLVVADALAKMKDRARALQISDAMFGDVGVRGQRLLSLGRDGIARLAREAHDKGLILDQRTIEAAQRYREVKRKTMQTLIGFRNEIASKLLPAMVNVIEGFRAWWETGDNAEKATVALTVAVKALGLAIAALGLKAAIVKLKALAAAAAGAAVAVNALARSILFAAGKVIAFAAPFVAIFLIIRALVRFARGKEGWLSRFMGDGAAARALRDVLEGIAEMGRQIGAEFKPLADAIAEPFEKITETIKELLAEINIDLSGVVKVIATALKWALVAVLSIIWLLLFVFLKVVRGIKWGIDRIVDAFRWLGRQASDVIDAIKRAFGTLADALLAVMASIAVLWDGFISVLRRAWTAFVEGIKSVFGGLKSFAKRVTGAIAGFFVSAAKRARGAWGKTVAAIKRAFAFVKRKFGEGVSKVKDILGITPETTGKGTITPEQARGALRTFGVELPATAPTTAPVGAPAGAPISVQTGGSRSVTSNVGTIAISVTGTGPETVGDIVRGLDDRIKKVLQDAVNSTSRDFVGQGA